MTKHDVLSYLKECRKQLENQFPDVKQKNVEEMFDYFFAETTSRSIANNIISSEVRELRLKSKFDGVEILAFDIQGFERGKK